MRVLVSAGPTREMIDDVRFLSNLSSGRTGVAVAEAARDLGHDVTLVLGPVAVSPPEGMIVLDVVSAVEMRDAVCEAFPEIDLVVMTAAVCDYRPAERRTGKLKKGEGSLALDLVRNPDILEELGRSKRSGQALIGFALEVQDGEAHARGKLERKNLDLVVLNGPANFGSASSRFSLVSRAGIEAPQEMTKRELGELLVRRGEELTSTGR